MKAVVKLTQSEREKYARIYNNLKEATNGYALRDLFADFTIKRGYAHYKFSGKIQPILISLLGRTPTTEEIILLVDSGYRHFGASCSLNGDIFNGRVNTD